VLTEAFRINNNGEIVGWYDTSAAATVPHTGFVFDMTANANASTVPEPATAFSALGAFGAMGLWIRRRRSAMA
jgi:hypothetical protein